MVENALHIPAEDFDIFAYLHDGALIVDILQVDMDRETVPPLAVTVNDGYVYDNRGE